MSPKEEGSKEQVKKVDEASKRQETQPFEKQVLPTSEKPQEISPDMKMNVQLMNGELPQYYVDLLTRFTV